MRHVLALTLAAAVAASPSSGRAADAAVVSGLVRNAWYWQAREREDRAEQAWRRVLAIAPGHPEALAAVGGFEARSGRGAEARQRLDALQRANPGHPDVPVLRRQIELGPRFDALLGAARRLAHDGQRSAAIARYRDLLGGAPPPGDLALEYYQTIAGVADGWQEARDGLERTVRRAPAEPRYRVALAKVLTYRDATRRQGIEMLAELSRNPEVAPEAAASWRQAVLWLRGSAEDDELLRAYARSHPGDRAVARRLESDRRSGSVRKGFAALDRGDLEAAQRLFSAAGEAQDARLGLALVAQRRAGAAQREGDLARARGLLQRARALAPDHPEVWDESLRSVAFWSLLREARAAREGGRPEVARARLEDAVERAPARERWNADLALADLDRAERRPGDAERRYRDVLAAAPDQPDALRGLASVLVDRGRFDDAASVNERLLRVAPARAYRPEWLAAEAHRATAARLTESGDAAAALTELREARRVDPGNAWVLHDLAGALVARGALPEARDALGQLLRVAPALPEARVVEARILAAEGQDATALAVLASLPPESASNPAVVALRQRLQVNVRLPALSSAASEGPGPRAAAAAELAGLERAVQQQPDLVARIALAWSKLGDRERALAAMRTALARAPSATRGVRIALASELLEAGDDAGFSELLATLRDEPSLTPDERRSLAELTIAYAVRTADRSREAGDAAAGHRVLAPVIREHPQDPRLLAALGRLDERADPRRAHAAFTRALAGAPRDRDARRGAIATALATGDVDGARRLAEEGLRLDASDPAAHLAAARVALAADEDRAANAELTRARELLDGPRVSATFAGTPLPEGTPQRAALDAEAVSLREQVLRESATLRDRHRPVARGEFTARIRRGEAGMGSLLDLRQAFEAELPVGYAGRAVMRACTVELDAGTLASSAGSRFGAGRSLGGALRQTAVGTELGARFETRWLSADVASTPIGFPVQSVVGGIRLQGGLGPVRLAIEGGRRSVVDSLLSYAGARDPSTGRVWGGVVAEGGRAELTIGNDRARLRLAGGGDRLVGTNVSENRRATGGAGVDVSLLPRGPWGDLTIGVGAAALSYELNRSSFTYGHGGYFSPQEFLHVGVPVRWSGGRALRWDASVEPAYHWSREDEARISPVNPPVQKGTYPAHSTEGFALDTHGALTGSAGPFRAGIEVALQQAPEYRELRGQLVLRYAVGGW